MSLNPFRQLAMTHAANVELEKRVSGQQVFIDWLCVRVNQLEKERAILFREVTQLPIPVPELVNNPLRTSADRIAAAQQNAQVSPDPFQDMGDAAAKKAGITFDDEGVAVYQ